MPIIPEEKKLAATSLDIINTIRDNAPYEYQQRIPEATQENLKFVGQSIMEYQSTRNEFVSALVNRIGKVIITSKSYRNQLRLFKKGILQYGETIEEIYVNIAKAHPFNPAIAEKEVFKRELPRINTAFHTVNYKNFYKVTISNEQLRAAFLTPYGVIELINGIIEQLYTGSEYDEFLIMKQMLIDAAQNGQIAIVNIPELNANNSKQVVSIIKSISNKMEFMNSSYNQYGVLTRTPKRDQVLIIDADADAIIDVEVLASAFNLDKAEFIGRRVLIDNFGELTGAYAALVDYNFFQIYDANIGFTENYNGEGLYWNYWYHVWKIFSTSPFSNAVLFSSAPTQNATSITISPTTANAKPGDILYFDATVEAPDYTGKHVSWELSPASESVINNGVVTISPNEKLASISVIAKTNNPDVSATATINITGNNALKSKSKK